MSEQQNNSVEPESDATKASGRQPNQSAATGESSTSGAPPEEGGSASLEEQLAATRIERDENRDRFLRAQAELENYKRRTQRELSEERRYAALPIVRDVLPAIDNFQRALDAARNTNQVADLIQGLEMVIQQLEETLRRYGTTPIAADGEPFDPNVHEAVQQVPSAEHPPLTVLQEVERGYTLHDRVVRPSKVIVSAPPPAESEENTTES
jgi:molecular chaperone GrpE